RFPVKEGETLDQLLARLRPMFFDPAVDPTVTSKTPRPGTDILTASANNLYVGLRMKDLEGYREAHPLNSRLVKNDGRIVEEVYLDARSIKGAWEGLVFYVNREKTSEIRKLAENAQWFEDHMPWDPKYRKPGVHGITANAIDVVIETGDSGPITPVGINLPNDQVIRERYGSKSVSLSNV